MMEALQIVILILFHQVVLHSCRGISDFPDSQESDDDDLKYEDIRSILRLVPKTHNTSRSLLGIKKHKAGPIAIILAPSNKAAKFHRNQKIPGLDRDTKNGLYADGYTGTAEKAETAHTIDKDKLEVADHKSLEKFVNKHETIDEMVKTPTVKSHNYTHFIVDKSILMNDNDDSSQEILDDSNSVPDKIEKSMDDKNEFNNGVLDDITTGDNTREERKEKDIISKDLVTPESINKNDVTYFNIIDTKLQNLSEMNDGEHDLNKSSTKVSVNYIFGEQLNKALNVFNPDIECIRTDVRNCSYRVINLLFNFQR
ncbi:uncharacterized protein LOC125061675 [Pieris napi]|uniref:uncharacterized protein LOC125061675 n=1 Tax=Pieris napi TaxID=78633 RepID=UPI001FB966F1|nr:uncharacterized protein LOC125061675 [Pieris napi]